MSDEILISVGLAETRAALLAHGRLQELEIWRPDQQVLAGAIYLGRVSALAPGLDGAFVALGEAREGFLGRRDLGPAAGPDDGATAVRRRLNEGQAVLVQVRRAASGGKGALLTMAPTLPGHTLAYRPHARAAVLSRRIAEPAERTRLRALAERLSGPGGAFIVRTAAAGIEAAALEREAEALRQRWREIEAAAAGAAAPACLDGDDDPVIRTLREHLHPGIASVRLDDGEALRRARAWCRQAAPWALSRLALHEGEAALFERHGVEAAIEAALGPRLMLPGGGWLSIESTEALTAIDVNAGAAAAGERRQAVALATNLEAAAEIARQLRLRRLGGLVVIDFLRLDEAGDAGRVLAALDAALAGDPTPTRRSEFSAFGLVELSRRRRGAPLAERLGEPCRQCRGRAWQPTARTLAEALLRRAVAEARRSPGGVLRLIAAPEVIEALAGLPGLDAEALSRVLGRRVALVGEPGRAREAIEVAWQQREGRHDEA